MAKPKEGVSSFQRANLKRPCIPGTRLSLRNAQLLVSSGIPSFDNFIGGGLPVGTIYCIEEDVSGVFSTLMLKHFLAEGVLNGHFITLASRNAQPQELVKELPTPVVDSVASHTNSDQMKIAWRYEGLNPNEGSDSKTSFGHIFDTSKVMNIENLDFGRIAYWDPSEDVLNDTDSSLGPYLNLLKFISRQIEACDCKVESKSDKKNIIRIALHCVASPLWPETSSMSSKQMLPQFLKFMYCLKSIVRSSYAVCMVTVPVHLFRDPCTTHRLRHVVDISAHVESFMDAEDETNVAYKEYSGLFHFKKLFSINTIVPHPSEGLDLAFKLRRKRFIIEKLCLPPDLSSSESSSSLGCASSVLKNPSSKRGCGSLDF